MSNASRDKDNRKSISVLEIKLRSEIDTLRRQVTKLKKALAIHDAAAAAALGDVASPVGAETAAHSQVEAADTLPVAPTAELGEGVALARSPADAALRLGGVRVRELLRAVSHISGHLDLGAVLQGVAEGIRDALGYRIVMIRLCDAATQRLEARAFVGLRASERARLEADPIAVDEFRSWLKEDFRIGRAFLIGHQHPFARVLPEGVVSDLGDRVAGEWHPEDVLLVPLQNVDGELLGYVSVDDPVDRQVPSQETVELLEVFAGHAVVAIQNARLYSQLGEHTRQLEQANDRLQELHVLKSHFVSTISHELRTPLTAIRAYVDTLLTLPADRQEPEQTRRFLQVINEESHRLSRLIESVLDLSRFDAGAVQPRRESHNLAELVRETSELLRPIADAARVVLKVVEVEADTHVDADRDQMRQLLLHLGGNAIKFTPAGGSVVLRLTGGERGVSLFVEDTGIGIPEPELDKIFDRFYQIDSSLVRQYGGTGLGLAISRSIVESHGGEIVATSTPGKGSTFQVRLPRHAGPRVLLRSHPEGAKPSDDVLRIAVEMVSEAMDARVVSVMGLEPDGDLVIRAAAGLDLWVVQETRVRPGDGVAGWVAQNRRPLAVGDVTTHDSLPSANGLPRYRSRTFLSVPLEGEHGMLGVLNVTDPLQERAFGTEDCGLLLELAARVSRAWQKADRVDRGHEGHADVVHR
ncbi:MAG: GAF domain-containing protein, partial [Candidatus Eisenbacteria bacterium]|nr:GAF domain-containing protein [Candidatus Eisenbacteria bacterium]